MLQDIEWLTGDCFIGKTWLGDVIPKENTLSFYSNIQHQSQLFFPIIKR